MKTVYAVLAVLALSACGSSNSNSPATAQQKSYGAWKPSGNYCQDLGAGVTCGLNAKPTECNGVPVIDHPIRFNGTGKTVRFESGPFPTQWNVVERQDGLSAVIPTPNAAYELRYGDTTLTIQADLNGRCITEFVRE